MSEFPTRRTFAVLAGLAVAFVLYGSLVPFHLSSMSVVQAQAGIESFLRMDAARLSRTDFATNVALLLPVGFCLMGALTLNRTIGAASVLVTLTLGTAVALAAEMSQVFFPDRTPSMVDVYAQCVGNLAGIIGWCVIGPSVASWLQGLHEQRDGARRATGVLGVIVAGIVVADLLPLDLTVRPAELAAKYREGRVIFHLSGGLGLAAIGDWLFDVVSRVPFGMLALVGWTTRGRRRDVLTAIALGWLLVAVVEVAQLFVWSRVSDVTDLVTGGAGVIAGVAVASVLWASGSQPGETRAASRAPIARLGLIGWIACLAVYHWSPFDFRGEVAFARERLPELGAIPFSTYVAVPPLALLRDVLAKVAMSLALGALMRFSLPRGSTLGLLGTMAAVGVGTGLLMMFEAGQLLLPARNADLTDTIVGVVAMSIGFVSAGRFGRPVADGPPVARLVEHEPWTHFHPRPARPSSS